MVQASQHEGLLVSEKAQAHFGVDRIQALNLQAKQQESATTKTRGQDLRALERETGRRIIENRLAEAEQEGLVSPAEVEAKLKMYDQLTAAGFEPATAAEQAERTTTYVASAFRNPIDQVLLGLFGGSVGGVGVELGDVVEEELKRGPQIHFEDKRVLINTMYQGTEDPRTWVQDREDR